MAKSSICFTCTQCSYQTRKWLGCCPECNQWDTFQEQATQTGVHKTRQSSGPAIAPLKMVHLDTVIALPNNRMESTVKEWDRVTGGGIVPGAFIILAGDPGIGKSTLLLQVAHKLAQRYSVLYFSSEESLEQVKLRAQRLQCTAPQLLFSDQANLEEIIATAKHLTPDLIIIDSIQNCYATQSDALPGSINQLKESAFTLMRLAKEHTIAVLLSGHITKDGMMAGPKTLEHMVDTVLYLQGEDRWQTRILRALKNRFGAINELGFFEMQEHGLQEMPNINKQLLEEVSHSPGSVLISYMEGTRPLLVELQALTVPTKFSMPQRLISGVDPKQVILIAAILEKYLKIKLNGHDIFFRVSGGFKLKESASDLGIALALLSSYFQQTIPEKSIALAEISLTGHIKPINHINVHLNEAEKFGIVHAFIARNQKIENFKPEGSHCTLQRFTHIYELLSLFSPDTQ